MLMHAQHVHPEGVSGTEFYGVHVQLYHSIVNHVDNEYNRSVHVD